MAQMPPAGSASQAGLSALTIQALPATQSRNESLRAALLSGREQGVIVQYRQVEPTGEDERQGREQRQALKRKVFARLSAGQAKLRRDFSELPVSALTLARAEALAQLLADPDVEAVFPDKRLQAHTPQALPLIQQPTVANVMGRQGTGKSIAVLDTGVNYTRAEFGSCTAPGVPTTCKVVAAYEAASDDNAPDAQGHGTDVALAALAVAPGAGIVAIDVFDPTGALSSDVIEGINWAITNRNTYNITAINMSLGDGVQNSTACTSANDPFASVVNTARMRGLVVVVSAGNEGYSNGVGSPACVSNAIAVGAVYDANLGPLSWTLNQRDGTTGVTTTTTCTDSSTTADRVTCFSSSGALLDVLAPGALITVGGRTTAGTSLSAPMVSGAVAVLRAQFPAESASQIEARILNSGPSITDPRNALVRRRLDLLAAQGAPSNDAFAAAAAISGSSGTVSTWNFNATLESGEPLLASQTGGHSLWWAWTAPGDGTLTLNTQGSSIDSLLGVFVGNSVSALAPLGSNDDTPSGTSSSLKLGVVGGQVYKIGVDGKAGSTGALSLQWAHSTTLYQADLSVALGLDTMPLKPGVGANLQISFANAGPQAVSTGFVVLTLPAGLSATPLPGGCSLADGNITCALGALAVGAQGALSLPVTASAEGELVVNATTISEVPDAATTNSAASLAVQVKAPGSGGGSGGGDLNDGDVPLPGWALALLAAGLLRAKGRRVRAER